MKTKFKIFCAQNLDSLGNGFIPEGLSEDIYLDNNKTYQYLLTDPPIEESVWPVYVRETMKLEYHPSGTFVGIVKWSEEDNAWKVIHCCYNGDKEYTPPENFRIQKEKYQYLCSVIQTVVKRDEKSMISTGFSYNMKDGMLGQTGPW